MAIMVINIVIEIVLLYLKQHLRPYQKKKKRKKITQNFKLLAQNSDKNQRTS